MAKITREDLEVLTSAQIKRFYEMEDVLKYDISPIKEYIREGKTDNTIGNRINRVKNLLTLIVVDRFLDIME